MSALHERSLELAIAESPGIRVIRGRRLVVDFVYPPIPDRQFDCCVYDDSLGADASPYGWGRTEDEAIADFFENAEEDG